MGQHHGSATHCNGEEKVLSGRSGREVSGIGVARNAEQPTGKTIRLVGLSTPVRSNWISKNFKEPVYRVLLTRLGWIVTEVVRRYLKKLYEKVVPVQWISPSSFEAARFIEFASRKVHANARLLDIGAGKSPYRYMRFPKLITCLWTT